jgi:hypothetical protein
MPSTHTLAQGTRSSSVFNLGTLGSGSYSTSSVIDLGATIPIDVTFEVECDPNGTPTGNKQLVLFAQFSLDNTNFNTTLDATNEADSHLLGVLPCNDTNTHRKFFSLAGLPVARYVKIGAKNDMGVALTSGNVYRSDITGVTT